MAHQGSKLKLAIYSLLAFIMMLAMSIAAFMLLFTGWRQHADFIVSQQSLIVLSNMHGYGPGIIIGTFSGALLFLLYFFYRCIFQTETILFKRAEKLLASLTMFGLIAMFAGSYFISSYWQDKAGSAGYFPCPPMILLTNRVTMEVWVKNEALCYDRDVRRIISRGTPA
ncbi:hypothetical protein VT06_06830, partial [Arsukibacterium sp. MJ3]|uniref:hypothetical protein n=1 Tax=Arsukibacterium sp. MJ3 TaxID=1632859 RepID=UPI0006273085